MFIAYEVSVQLIHSLRDLVPKIQKFDRSLADQMQRAATSVTLNLAEGQRLRAGHQRKHYEIAHGSANEVKAALDLAEAWGWVADTEAPRQILDRQLALLWRLTHGRMVKTNNGKPSRRASSVGESPIPSEQAIERDAS